MTEALYVRNMSRAVGALTNPDSVVAYGVPGNINNVGDSALSYFISRRRHVIWRAERSNRVRTSSDAG